MPRRLVFLDTSFIIALENRDDSRHTRAKLVGRELTASQTVCVLHWGVLFEIGDGYARLGRRAKGLELFEKFQHEEGYDIQPISEPLFEEALALYRKHRTRNGGSPTAFRLFSCVDSACRTRSLRMCISGRPDLRCSCWIRRNQSPFSSSRRLHALQCPFDPRQATCLAENRQAVEQP